jgi:hypothetical protein
MRLTVKTNTFPHFFQKTSQSMRQGEDVLKQFNLTWGKIIKSLLKFVAMEKWGNYQSFRGIIRRKNYRLRVNKGPGYIIWWIEHDIPPYDLYRCEAYRVTARIEGVGEPLINVESNTDSIQLYRPSLKDFENALKRIVKQPPLHIPRRMGEAWE